MAKSSIGILNPIDEGRQTTDPLTPTTSPEISLKWIKDLSSTPVGKRIVDYIAHVDGALRSPDVITECPLDVCVTFRRVLMHGLATQKQPFGLPKRLPKFIAIVSLCGSRLMLTSETASLFQLLAHSPCGRDSCERCIEGVKTMISFQQANPEMSLVLTYALPFQVEFNALFWEIRSVSRVGNLVIDGQLAYQIGEARARPTGCTRALELESSTALLDAQVAALSRNLTAICIDAPLDDAETASTEETSTSPNTKGSTVERLAKLETMCAMLQASRKQMLEEHRLELREIQDAATKKDEMHINSTKAAYEKERALECKMQSELQKLRADLELSRNIATKQEVDLRAMEAEHKAKELRWEDEVRSLQKSVSIHEASASNFGKQLASAQSSYAKTSRKQETEYSKTIDIMEREKQRAIMGAQRAENGEREALAAVQRLERLLEAKDTEQEVYRSEARDQRRRITKLEKQTDVFKKRSRVYKSLLHVGAIRYSSVTENLASVTADLIESRSFLEKNETELTTSKAVLETTRVELIIAEGKNASVDQPQRPSAKPATVEVATLTDMLSETLEIGELNAAFVKATDQLAELEQNTKTLKQENDNLKTENARLSKRRKPPPPYCLPNEPKDAPPSISSASSETVGSKIELGSSDGGDLGTEFIISQAVNAMRALADAARNSRKHHTAACEAWSTTRALQAQLQSAQHVPQFGYQLVGSAGFGM
jgi:hypothetical protein